MGEIKPEIKVVKLKPPAEPPPSLEVKEEELHKDKTAKIAILKTST